MDLSAGSTTDATRPEARWLVRRGDGRRRGSGDDAVIEERGDDGWEPEDAPRVPSPGTSRGRPEQDDGDGSATEHIRRRPAQPSATPAPDCPPGTFTPAGPPPPAGSFRPGRAAPTTPAEPRDESRAWARPSQQDGGNQQGGYQAGSHEPSGQQIGGYDVVYPTGGYAGAGPSGAAGTGGYPADPYPGDGGHGDPPGGAAGSGSGVEPPARGWRPSRKAMIFTAIPLVLLLLFVIVDRVAVGVAEREMAKQLRTSVTENLACGAPPPTVRNVSIGGFPFLTQILFGKFQSVGVTVEDLSTPGPRIQSVQAKLKGIHVPFGQIVSGKVGDVKVDSAQATVRVRYDDLNTYLAKQPGDLQVNPMDDGRRVEISGTADIPFIGSQRVGGVTTFQVRDNKLTLVPSQVTLSGLVNLSIPLGDLGQLLPSIPIPVGDLPFQLDITRASTDASGLSLSATATDLTLPKEGTKPTCPPS